MRVSTRTLRVTVLVFAVLAGLTLAAATVPAQRALVVEDASTGDPLVVEPVNDDTVISLAYMHSVEKSPVHDVYTVDGDRLVMTHAEFDSYGWGFPSDANVTVENGSFAYDPDWEGEELYVKPGRIAGHTLHVNDETYDLVAISDAQSVRIHVDRRPPLAIAFHEFEL